MAIYHLSMQAIKRSEGRSSVAAAAYRAGQALTDERTGLTHEYARADRVLHAELFAPPGSEALAASRAAFWNLVEQIEKRKDATVARELVIALPRELTDDQRKDLARDFAATLSRRYGIVVDLAIHDDSKATGNHHAHVMFSDRLAIDGQLGKKDRAWGVGAGGRERTKELRHLWEEKANAALQAAGHDARISAASLKDRGEEREPNLHEGPSARAMHERGESSERVQINADNKKLVEAGKRLSSLTEIIEAKKAQEAAAAAAPRVTPAATSTEAPEAAKTAPRGVLIPALMPKPQTAKKKDAEAEEPRREAPPQMEPARRRKLIEEGQRIEDIKPVLARYGEDVRIQNFSRIETTGGDKFAFSTQKGQWFLETRDGTRPAVHWIAKREGLSVEDAAVKNALDTQAERTRQIELDRQRERERSQSAEQKQDQKNRRGYQPK